jgi:uncharacterized protein YjbI with pentapeptide repeats
MTVREWLGLNNALDLAKITWIGRVLGNALLLLFILGIIATIIAVPAVFYQFLAAALGMEALNAVEKHEAIRNTGLVVVAIIGAPFVVWRAVVAQKQVNVAEQSHITDRISKAVEQLGAEKVVKSLLKTKAGEAVYDEDGITPKTIETTASNIEVRMGGIFALERIARDSPPDHLQILEILTAYIRENAPASGARNPPEPAPEQPKDISDEAAQATYHEKLSAYYLWDGPHHDWAEGLKPRNDIQAAIKVIGRRPKNLRALEVTIDKDGKETPIRLDLRETCLQGADMTAGVFNHTQFDESRMEAALLNQAELNGARLNRAELNGAWLNEAWLNGANLYAARLNTAWLFGARLNGAKLSDAWLIEAQLHRAQINGAELYGAQLNGANFHAAQTRLAAVQFTDLSVALNLDQDQVNAMFGDATTTLPDGITPPDWHAKAFEVPEFFNRWRAAKNAAGFR